MPSPASEPIPVVLNPAARTASRAREALDGDVRFRLRSEPAEQVGPAIRTEVERGTPRVAIVGGDGTVAAAAGAVGGSRTELAIVPGGTRNHFARHLGIPMSPGAAMDLAASGTGRPVPVGWVNDRLFLNTSSIGAYVTMVRLRERLEPALGYHLAALAATAALVRRLRTADIEFDTDRGHGEYRTPLLFIGVGERDLKPPHLGERTGEREESLHLLCVRGGGPARLLALALAATTRGVRQAARTTHLDSFLIRAARVTLPRPRVRVAVDGEIVTLDTPLTYRLDAGGVRVVTIAEAGGEA